MANKMAWMVIGGSLLLGLFACDEQPRVVIESSSDVSAVPGAGAKAQTEAVSTTTAQTATLEEAKATPGFDPQAVAYAKASLMGKSWSLCDPYPNNTSSRIQLVFESNIDLSEYRIGYMTPNCTGPLTDLQAPTGRYKLTPNAQNAEGVWDVDFEDAGYFGKIFTKLKVVEGKLMVAFPSETIKGTSANDRAANFLPEMAYVNSNPQFAAPPAPCPAVPPRSVDATTSVDFVYHNKQKATVNLYWVDTVGKEFLYHTIPANGSIAQQSFLSHVWVARDEAGKCLTVFTALNALFEY